MDLFWFKCSYSGWTKVLFSRTILHHSILPSGRLTPRLFLSRLFIFFCSSFESLLIFLGGIYSWRR
ncbi:Protein of unknown function [Pyronema omphalodes CBS 100304]|uniref:Uncharacterized protein n=1 Tax=Pyronema omphalodes (strain CBS 100304) TaxID=1076935 RepID=U4LR28_PYROM|nr:Protein of unknown function [Pyronema omphalodes CBS 100304]